MKDSLLGYTLFKDLFLCYNVQVDERCVQQVEVCIFIHSPEGVNTQLECKREAKKRLECVKIKLKY